MACESTRLVGLQQDSRDRALVLGCVFVTLAGCYGTYYWMDLLPAWEKDPSLKWGAMQTATLNTMASMAEMAGLFMVGPAGDHFRSGWLIGFEAAVIVVSMIVVDLSRTSLVIIPSIVVVNFVKGLLWPLLGAVVASNLSRSKHDQAYAALAFGSRLGNVTSVFIVGFLLTRTDWQRAVLAVLSMIVLFYVAAWALVPKDLATPGDAERPSLDSFQQKGQRMLGSTDNWCTHVVLFGTTLTWSYTTYLAVVLSDVYGTPPGESTINSGFLALGSTLGLIAGFLSSRFLGVEGGRVAHVFQVTLSIGAFGMLAAMPVPLMYAKFLVFLAGFGSVLAMYLPWLICCGQGPPAERSFRLAMQAGTNTFYVVLFNFLFGVMREQSTDATQLFRGFNFLAMLGLVVALIAMVTLYARLYSRAHDEMCTATGP